MASPPETMCRESQLLPSADDEVGSSRNAVSIPPKSLVATEHVQEREDAADKSEDPHEPDGNSSRLGEGNLAPANDSVDIEKSTNAVDDGSAAGALEPVEDAIGHVAWNEEQKRDRTEEEKDASPESEGVADWENDKETDMLNVACEAIEAARKANLEVEFAEVQGAVDFTRCTKCLRVSLLGKVDSGGASNPPAGTESVGSKLFPQKHASQCLICGNPACPQHSHQDFRRAKVVVCDSCAPLFSLDYLVEKCCIVEVANAVGECGSKGNSEDDVENQNRSVHKEERESNAVDTTRTTSLSHIIDQQENLTTYLQNFETLAPAQAGTIPTTADADTTATTPDGNETALPESSIVPSSKDGVEEGDEATVASEAGEEEGKSWPAEADALRREHVSHVLDAYDHALLHLRYSYQFIPQILTALRQTAKRNNWIELGSIATNLVSGITGVAAAATILTPVGPPLVVASLVFGGSATALLVGSEVVNYKCEPSRLANRIITLHAVIKSILRLRNIVWEKVGESVRMENSTINGQVFTQGSGEMGLTLGEGCELDEAVEDKTKNAGEKSGVSWNEEGGSENEEGTVAQHGTDGSKASVSSNGSASRNAVLHSSDEDWSRTSTNAFRSVSTLATAGAIYDITVVIEAWEMALLLQRMQAGDPCDNAEALEEIQKELEHETEEGGKGRFPETGQLAHEFERYAVTVASAVAGPPLLWV